ncbi:hypothetical protein [Actinoplanes subglobosus]|uniref:HNH endonuclease n=1 Tax=Actinoplanes subglobosus TaxID=1547892 RepID=A0ABV8IX21_9ACTN
MAGRTRDRPARQPPADGGAKIVSAILKNANVFKTGKGKTTVDPDKAPEAVLVLRRGTGFHAADFDRKARDLKKLADAGKLKKATPAERGKVWDPKYKISRTKPNTHRWRMIRQIDKSPERKASAARTRAGILLPLRKGYAPQPGDGGLDPDHIHELQLDGGDEYTNLRLMDAYTNRTMGSEIQNALRDVPFGTRIRIEIED